MYKPQSLWCASCKCQQVFISGILAKKRDFAVASETKASPSPRKVKFVHRRKGIIGQCTYPNHPKELKWADIEKEQCLVRRCDHFSWISLSARDVWHKEHVDDKRPAIRRCGTPQQRKIRRRELNLRYLTSHDVTWEWISEECDHVLILGHIDYFLGKTRWHDRNTKECGYMMIRGLLKGK
jgi:hypothetical protein